MDGWARSKPAPLPVYIVLAGEEGGMSHSRYKEKTCQRTDELLGHHTNTTLFAICTSLIIHLVYPPSPHPHKKKKLCTRIVLNFSWDNYNAQEKLKAKVMQTLVVGEGGGGGGGKTKCNT